MRRVNVVSVLDSVKYRKREVAVISSGSTEYKGILSREQLLGEINQLASRCLEDCRLTITTKSGTVITKSDPTLLMAKVRALELMAGAYGMLVTEKRVSEGKPEVVSHIVWPDSSGAAENRSMQTTTR
jgi:hypothetical protein